MNSIIPTGTGKVLGVDHVSPYVDVAYGYMGVHEFNLVCNKFDGNVVYTLYLDRNTVNPCFDMEPEEVAIEKIKEIISGQ